MKKKAQRSLLWVAALTAVLALAWTTMDVEARGNRPGPVIYVVTQQLYYDSIVTADPLPPHGKFQVLRPGGGPLGGDLNTDFGPGDRGYRGGRWVLGGDHYFSCPLLGPGREIP
jgi:hypothetical protein